MVSIMSLWLPILLSAVLVFVVSSIIHMALPYHRSDYRAVPSEDKVMEALRPFNLAPGDYLMPRPSSMADMKTPAFQEKREKGPVAVMTVAPKGPHGMGRNLILWFLYSVVVGVLAAYVAGRAVGPGAPYLQVFRFAGSTAFIAYAMSLPQQSIWYWKSWATTLKGMFDGLVYGLLTAGVFGWLWPR
jgi:hypothetical protein